MECFEKDILTTKDTGGVEARFGSIEAVAQLIKKIAFREGIGDLLAQGVRKASQQLGKGTEAGGAQFIVLSPES